MKIILHIYEHNDKFYDKEYFEEQIRAFCQVLVKHPFVASIMHEVIKEKK